MVVLATDVPPAGAVAKSDTANVVITVRRNPNGPVFTAETYETTISEYKSVQQSVIRTVATDDDPDGVSKPQPLHKTIAETKIVSAEQLRCSQTKMYIIASC